MRILTILALLSLPLLYTGSTRADAAAWCARYENGQGTNCGFATFDQCEADIFGMNGSYCAQNPAAPSETWRRSGERTSY